ncbi:MAG TPA: glycosyltransferase [Acidobacteriota bacterium]|nr:glycosyltransferase [Acidobacteriota bacterium]
MKIVYAVDQYWPAVSGVPVSVDTFRNELTRAGHEVHVIAPDYPGANLVDRQMGNNGNVHRFRSRRLLFSKADRLVRRSERPAIHRLLDRLQPDIIHAQTEFMVGTTCLAYARRRNIPCLCTAHTNWEQLANLYLPILPGGLWRYYARSLLHRVYDRTDAVVVPTTLMRDLLVSYRVKVPLEIIPTGITPSEFDGVDRLRENGSSKYFDRFPALVGKRILLAAGRVGWEKNLAFLMNVLGRLVPEFPDVILMVVGDGPYRRPLERLANLRGLNAHVVFTGFVPKMDMKEVYAIADVLVFASKVETQGLVTIEAMYCGVPVVAVGEMGTREVMQGDNGGFMVKDDLDDFTEKTRRLLGDAALHRCKSLEAQRHARDWTIEAFAAKLLRLYRSLVDRGQGGAEG